MFKVKIKTLKGKTGRTFLQELTRRKNELSKPMAGTLVGDNNTLDWVLYQEFGTATRREASDEYGIAPPTSSPYRIPSLYNTSGKQLVFPDPLEKYVTLDRLENGYVITDHVFHPGVRPKFFIRQSLDKIRNETRELISQAILFPSQPYSRKNIKEVLLGPVMRLIVDHITESMSEVLKQDRVDGKLQGEPPDQVFRANIRVVDSSNEITKNTE